MPPVPPLFRRLVVCVLAVVAITAAARAQSRVVAYVPNWVELNSFSASIDYAKLTHINIAFENPTNDRGDVSFHADRPASVIAEEGLKTLLVRNDGYTPLR